MNAERRRRLALVSAALAGASFAVVAVPAWGGPGPTPGSGPWLATFALGAAVVAGLTRLARIEGPRQRTAWDLIGLWVVLFAAAGIWFTTWYATDVDPAVPSPPDALFLMAYGCLAVGVVLLYFRPDEEAPRSAALDGVLIGLALATVAEATVLEWIVGGGPEGREVIVIAYALIDVCLLGTLAALGRRDAWTTTRGRLLVLAAGLMLAADLAYLRRVASEDLSQGAWYHPLYLAAALAVGAAAWAPARAARHERVETARMVILPGSVAVVSAVVLVWDHYERRSDLAIVLATAALIGVAVRAGLTVRFLRGLVDSRRLALTDDLTGLPNRRWFLEQLDRAVASREEGFAVLVLGIDRFKVLNDTLGHDVGDQVLRDCGARLQRSLRNDDVLVRLGGDEFGILPSGTVAATARVVASIQRAFSSPLDAGGLAVPIGLSIGGAAFPEHGRASETLLRRADVALLDAKHSQERWAMYRAERDPFSFRRLALASELHEALGNGELSAVYQPIVSVASGAFVSAEALVRWDHPTFGTLLPGQFLDVAQQIGFMKRVTDFMLETSLAQHQRWRDEGFELGVAVNLPPQALMDVGLPARVDAALAQTGASASALTLELTENGLLEDPETALRILHELRDRGVRLAVDDYGVDYASLSYLRDLPVHALKIDRSFLQGIDRPDGEGPAARNGAIVRSTIVLAHDLGFEVVAEGVEDASSLQHLTAWGVDAVQGFLIAEPLPGSGMATARHIWDHRPVRSPLRLVYGGDEQESRVARSGDN